MKQILVINVNCNSDKSRAKAMKIAVGFADVESVAIRGEDKNKIEVVGNGVDAAKLTSLLRKRLGYAVLETLARVENGEEDKKPDPAPTPIQPLWPFGPGQYGYDQHPVYEPNYCSTL